MSRPVTAPDSTPAPTSSPPLSPIPTLKPPDPTPAPAVTTALRPAAVPDASGLRWVLDPHDDAACLRAMSALHQLDAGRVVCPTRPNATWPVLVRDLLTALGKHAQALTRERRSRHGDELLRVWLRAEDVRHLVVLRGHLLAPDTVSRLAALAAGTGVLTWPVWHRPGIPTPDGTAGIALPWAHAVATIRGDRSSRPRGRPVTAGHGDRLHAEVLAAARVEGHRWRTDPPRPRARRYAHPRCELAATVQRLTIDATTTTELEACLQAARLGFATERMRLRFPGPTAAVTTALGPRLGPDTLTRLRQLVCPTNAAALMLALATDVDVATLTSCLPRFTAPDASSVSTLGGTYRVPPDARPLLRAALLRYEQLAVPGYNSVLSSPAGEPLGRQAMLHLIRRTTGMLALELPTAAHVGTGLPPAAPFADAYTSAVTIDPLDD